MGTIESYLLAILNALSSFILDIKTNKQNKLTAGRNITIVNDVISATGGGSETSDYHDLANKPQINDVTLIDNKSSSDLGLVGSSDIVDNLESFDSEKVLSSNQGRVLNERINNLEGIGRFLSLWNAETGLAESTPPQLPYSYDDGCYFRIGVIPQSGDILIPNGTQYTGEPSITIYTGSLTLEVGDLFIYDEGSNTWLPQKNQVGGKVQDVKVNSVSRVINGEVDFIGEEWTATLIDGTTVTKKMVLYD